MGAPRNWRGDLVNNVRKFAVALALATTFSTTLAVTAPCRAEALPSWRSPTAPISTRQLEFYNAGAELRGTLYLPTTDQASPVVVVFHSASNPLRDAALYRHLFEIMPALGIGVFVYDRRGSGESAGPSANGSFELLADDGVAARKMLEAVDGVDARRIGYWGLSQGGWLAILAARRDPKAAFAIAVSAPMVTADVQMRFAVSNILRIRGYDEAAVALAVDARLGVDEFMRGQTNRADAQARLDRAIQEPWFDQIYMSPTFADPEVSGWAREMRNDPLAGLRDVRIPTLVVYGSDDPWIPVTTSIERLAPLTAQQGNIQVRTIAGADHAMMNSASQTAQIDPASFATQMPEDPEYFAVLASWLAIQHVAEPFVEAR